MALVFDTRPIVKITAYKTGSTDKVSFDGITAAASLTPAIAATNINKIYDLVDMSVIATGMLRTSISEAKDDE